MIYNNTELNKLRKLDNKTTEEQIKFNILNFIYTIHLNGDDFIESLYDSEFFGELPMKFMKKEGQVMGLITVNLNDEITKYVFNNKGYERLEDLLNLENEMEDDFLD